MQLFKYLHPGRIEDVLNAGLIRFSQATALNDPFEFSPGIQGLMTADEQSAALQEAMAANAREEYARQPRQFRRAISFEDFWKLHVASSEQNAAKINEVATAMADRFCQLFKGHSQRDIGALCLSRSPINQLMWSHYADSHRGFLIEFDPGSEFFGRASATRDFGCLREVHYLPSRPSAPLVNLTGLDVFFTKGEDWRYESEWRMLLPLQQAMHTKGSGLDTVYLFAFPWDAVRSVVLGAKMSEEHRQQVRDLIANSPQKHHIRVLQAELDSSAYAVVIPGLDVPL